MPLLVKRRQGEEIVIGGLVTVFVKKIRGKEVQLGIVAPSEVSVKRGELVTELERKGAEREPRRRIVRTA